MTVTSIKIVLSPNSIGRLGTIHVGLQSIPSKAHNSVVGGTRVGDPRCSQVEKDMIQEEAPLSTKHQ